MIINGILADKYQENAIRTSGNILLIAGAGAGKTFTIIGKINYLIETLKIKPTNILVISFTNKSVNDLKNKIKYDVDIYTFHKLALSILESNNIEYKLASSDYLLFITNEFFLSLTDLELMNKICKYYDCYNYDSFLHSYYFNELVTLIVSFINIYKTNNFLIDEFKKIYRINSFLTSLILIIYTIYKNDLESSNLMDFDDIIINATKNVDGYKNYSYIIVDEFQDTSVIRWNLINELRKKSHAYIFAVGDDYQSIYHFSGCDINIFLNFNKLIEDSQVLKLVNTYRNSQELISISSNFIMKNNSQIKKVLISNKQLSKPIKYIGYFNLFKKFYFENLLGTLINKYKDILVLGRNNNDILDVISKNMKYIDNIIYYKDREIKYLTVHSAKGLEADVVIIINLNNGKYGFPNKIINNKLIEEIYPTDTSFLYAEERRLFYVALTRSRNEVYLFY
ncbi:MAG: UvrD-helicase domain-containing protein, partial [Bacilli bacterium]